MPLIRKRQYTAHHDGEEEHQVFLGADAIWPPQASRKSVLAYALVLGIAFTFTGVGTGIALHQTDSNRKIIEERSIMRTAQFNAQQAQIASLTEQLAETQTRQRIALCSALANSQTTPTNRPILETLIRDYGCTTPVRP